MRRVLILVMLVSVFAWGSLPAAAQSERVIVDAEIWVFPSEFADGHCLELPAGDLAVSFQAVGDRSLVYPVHFAFGAYRNLYSPANLQLDASRANTVATTPLESGLYCYSIANTVAVPVGANQAERVDLSQSVHLRMSILPSN